MIEKVIIEVSYNCNFACVMCGFGGKPINPDHFMRRDLFERTLATVPPEVRVIRLNGRGESTIHPEFADFLRIARDRLPDTAIELFTNGSWSSDDITSEVIRHRVQLFISMDSPDEAELVQIRRGCQYDRLIANLDRAASLAPTPFLVFTLQHCNLHRILDMARFARSRDLGLIYNVVRSDVQDNRLVRRLITRFPEVQDAFRQAMELFVQRPGCCQVPDQIQGIELNLSGAARTAGNRDGCPAVENEICVCFDGSVIPCNMFNPFVLGNLGQQSFSELLQSSNCHEFRTQKRTMKYCRNCAWMGSVA